MKLSKNNAVDLGRALRCLAGAQLDKEEDIRKARIYTAASIISYLFKDSVDVIAQHIEAENDTEKDKFKEWFRMAAAAYEEVLSKINEKGRRKS